MNYLEKIEAINPVRSLYIYVKRGLDIILAFLLLIPAGVLILVFGILVKLETPGPMFYTQERVGFMGRKIYIKKLRSMYNDAEKKTGAIWASRNDNRITKIGHFIRLTRIDELPQIISVIRGDLSLIGPRPERPKFVEQFVIEVPGFEKRLMVKPGLSGLAQIRGGYDATPAEKLIDDLEYINNFGLIEDLKIFLQTLIVVMTGHGAH
ncbi:sugar transferase [Weissella paramesenteroides]|uniref:Bacterial sugar transferase n=1 Tax=Weissella paramesenteroides ATCC 33313 TaxID=585506 RepID=C5RB68_WEIPA|nr:sugar transferase [Weissella paramesenteroides]ATF41868.1 UDP-phosphate N-acetylgalactosaminyl-1-phosphate transferase [Weissella paramesenteroides]EER74737.1 bacterial sugar transferase [Weissella paramesenteroides ATCC 33313]